MGVSFSYRFQDNSSHENKLFMFWKEIRTFNDITENYVTEI